MYKKIIFISISLGFILIINFFFERQSFVINIQGRAELMTSNTPKLGLSNFSSKPIKNSQIIAVFGKVRSLESNVSFPIKRLSRKKITTYTNSEGKFNFNLKPGIYTFFILNESNAYLNSFDGKGYYKSYKIFSKMDDIVITVISRSYF